MVTTVKYKFPLQRRFQEPGMVSLGVKTRTVGCRRLRSYGKRSRVPFPQDRRDIEYLWTVPQIWDISNDSLTDTGVPTDTSLSSSKTLSICTSVDPIWELSHRRPRPKRESNWILVHLRSLFTPSTLLMSIQSKDCGPVLGVPVSGLRPSLVDLVRVFVTNFFFYHPFYLPFCYFLLLLFLFPGILHCIKKTSDRSLDGSFLV